MANEAVLRIKYVVDSASAAVGTNTMSGATNRLRTNLQRAAAPAAAAGLAVAAFGKASFDAASRAQQAWGGVDAVFGKSAETIRQWGKTSAEAVGLAGSEYAELSTVLGSQLKNMGVPMGQLATKTNDLVKMGADLSATYGGTTKDAVEALSSALRGELDPIERYGVSLKAADIQAQMAAQGLDKLEGAQGKSARTAVLLSMLTNQTADAQGRFAQESNTAAGQAQRTSARWEDVKATLGESLLPAVTAVVEGLGKLLSWMQRNEGAATAIIAAIGAVAGAIVAMNVALTITAAIGSGVALVAAAVVAIGVAFVVAYNKVEWFRNGVNAVWNAVKTAAKAVASFLVSAWTGAVNAVRNVISGISRAWQTVSGAVRNAVSSVTRWIQSAWSSAVRAVTRVIQTLRNVWSTITGAIRSAVSSVTSFFSSAFRKAIATVSSAIQSWRNVASGVFGAVQSAMQRVWNAFSGLGSKIKSLMGGAAGWLVSVGQSIVQGLVDGINSAIGWVKSAVSRLAGMVPGWVKRKLGISSPSKVMAAIGKNITRGVAEGMDEGLTAVESVLDTMTEKISGAIDRAFEPSEKANKKTKRRLAARAKAANAAVTAAVAADTKALKDNAAARDALSERITTETSELDELRKQYDSLSESVRNNALAYASLSKITAAEGETLTAKGLINVMAERVAAVEDFTARLSRLRAAGLAESIIQDLAAAGVDGAAAQAAAIEAGGLSAIGAFNALQGRLDVAATTLGEQTANAMYGAGVRSQQALVDGLLADQHALEVAANTLANTLAAAVRKALRKALRNAPKRGRGNSNARLMSATTSAGVPPVPSARAASTAPVVTGPTIIVQGAIDPEATARQIRRILAGHDRRVGLAS